MESIREMLKSEEFILLLFLNGLWGTTLLMVYLTCRQERRNK
jgi:hypothetical protein